MSVLVHPVVDPNSRYVFIGGGCPFHTVFMPHITFCHPELFDCQDVLLLHENNRHSRWFPMNRE